nr:hypothetical protein CFP56_55104 [Quercus suber]
MDDNIAPREVGWTNSSDFDIISDMFAEELESDLLPSEEEEVLFARHGLVVEPDLEDLVIQRDFWSCCAIGFLKLSDTKLKIGAHLRKVDERSSSLFSGGLRRGGRRSHLRRRALSAAPLSDYRLFSRFIAALAVFCAGIGLIWVLYGYWPSVPVQSVELVGSYLLSFCLRMLLLIIYNEILVIMR